MSPLPNKPGAVAPPRLNPGNGTTARLLGHATAGPFRITHKAYTSAFTQAWHEHEAASIDFVLAGGGQGAYSGQDIPASAGGLGFYRHETRHRFISGPRGIRSMHIVIPAEVIADAGVPLDLGNAALDSAEATRLALAVFAELRTPADASGELQLESLVHALLGTVCAHARAERSPPGFLRIVREALHESAGSPRAEPISLSGLAALCDVHPGHLARAFKRHFGVTAGEYHRRLRALRAVRRLAGTGEPISRVARATGFADQAHLTRVLREQIGVTPAAMRRVMNLDQNS